MEVLKCGNCGGQLNYKEGDTIAKCSFCGYETNLKDIGEETVVRGIAISEQSKISTLIKRMSLLLEDEEFKKAGEVADNILNLDPENADAYLGKLFIDLGIKNEKCITDKYIFLSSLKENKNYKRVIQFGNEKQKEKIEKIKENRKELFKNISLTIRERLILSMSKIKESQEIFTFTKEESTLGCAITGSIVSIIMILTTIFPLLNDEGNCFSLIICIIGGLLLISSIVWFHGHFQGINKNKLKTELERKIRTANNETTYKGLLREKNNELYNFSYKIGDDEFFLEEKIKQFYVAYLIIDKKDYKSALNIVSEVAKEKYKEVKQQARKIENKTKELDELKKYIATTSNINEDDLNKLKENIEERENELLKEIEYGKELFDKSDKIHTLKYHIEYIIAIAKEDYHSIEQEIKDLIELNEDDFTGIVTLYKEKKAKNIKHIISENRNNSEKINISKNNTPDQFDIAESFYNQKKYQKAFKLFKKLAEQGDSQAQYNLGAMYENGEGIEENIEQAKYWYKKSADQGNEDAKEALKELEQEYPSLETNEKERLRSQNKK